MLIGRLGEAGRLAGVIRMRLLEPGARARPSSSRPRLWGAGRKLASSNSAGRICRDASVRAPCSYKASKSLPSSPAHPVARHSVQLRPLCSGGRSIARFRPPERLPASGAGRAAEAAPGEPERGDPRGRRSEARVGREVADGPPPPPLLGRKRRCRPQALRAEVRRGLKWGNMIRL